MRRLGKRPKDPPSIMWFVVVLDRCALGALRLKKCIVGNGSSFDLHLNSRWGSCRGTSGGARRASLGTLEMNVCSTGICIMLKPAKPNPQSFRWAAFSSDG